MSLLLVVWSVAPAFSATIATDLFVYQDGDTVTVTGQGFGPAETVALTATDPAGTIVDQGSAAADATGAFSYQFILHVTVTGIYTESALGTTSGLSAQTEFDPPQAQMQPKSQSFGNETVGATSTAAAFTLKSGGSADLTGCSAAFTGANPGDFAIVGTVPSSLAKGSTATFGVTFTPGAIGSRSATLSISCTGGGSDTSSLTGTGVAPSDTTGPTIAIASPTADTFVKTGSTVSLSATISDPSGVNDATVKADFSALGGGSAVAFASKSGSTYTWSAVTVGAVSDGAHAITVNASDTIGNASSVSVSVSVDDTAPSVSITAPAANTYYAPGASFSLTATVAGSGVGLAAGAPTADLSAITGHSADTAVAASSHSGTSYTWNVTVGAVSDGAHDLSVSASDALGNGPTSATRSFDVDGTAPTIAAAASPAPNGAGWNSSAVTVHFSCSDSGAGLASCPADVMVAADTAGQLVSGTAVDLVGNTATASLTVKLDTTPPLISGSRTPAANADGWNDGSVTTQFSCSDATSGVAVCPADVVLSGEGASQSVSRSATDVAGNSASATVSGINIDLTAPVTVPSVSPVPNASGWDKTSVSVTLDASDNLSGVKATHYTLDGGSSQLYAGPFPVSGDGTHTVSFWSVDLAGNVEATGTLTIKIDTLAPLVTGTPDRAANGAGWYTAPVTIHWTATDAGSGVDASTITSDTTQSLDGTGVVLEGFATDYAGNTGTATVTVNLDQVPPTISGVPDRAPNSAGWYNAPVTVTFTCNDGRSGVASCTAPVTLSADGANQSVQGTAVDIAGNSASTTVGGINLDGVAPVSQASATPDGSAGWFKTSPAQVSLTASDDRSGVASLHYTIDGGPESIVNADATTVAITGDGTHTLAYWAVDLASNVETAHSITVKLDTTPPLISGSRTPAANADGWNNSSVTAQFSCSDATSGVAACPADVVLSGEGADQSVSRSATDVAGNSASATVSGINIDLTAPVVSVSASKIFFVRGEIATYSVALSDALSGMKSWSQAAGTYPLDTSSLGSHTITVTSMDKAGNGGTGSFSYVIGYSSPGFLQPVTSTGVSINGFKQGSTIPVKFQAGDGSGQISDTEAQALASASRVVISVENCSDPLTCTPDNGTTVLTVTSTQADQGPYFRYDGSGHQFIYNLGTKNLSRGYYVLVGRIYSGGNLQGPILLIVSEEIQLVR